MQRDVMGITEQEKEDSGVEKRSNKTFWILVIVFILPYVAAMTYYLAGDRLPDVQTSNRGELVVPVQSLGSLEFDLLQGDTASINDYEGKWLVLSIAGSVCGDSCLHNLYMMRQVRKALAKDRFRVSRAMLFSGATESLQGVISDYEGTDVWLGPQESISNLIAIVDTENQGVDGRLYIIDPLGNVMMRYKPDTDPKDLLKDLQRLMKVSKAG